MGMNLQINENSQFSCLELRFRKITIRLDLRGPIAPRMRRQWLLLFHQEITRVMSDFNLSESHISHSGQKWFSLIRDQRREVSLRQAFKLHTERHRNGFRMRSIRLKAGLTQAEMARLLGTSRDHLSEFEHGHVQPRLATLAKWESILNHYLRPVPDALVVENLQPTLTDKTPTIGQGTIRADGEVVYTTD